MGVIFKIKHAVVFLGCCWIISCGGGGKTSGSSSDKISIGNGNSTVEAGGDETRLEDGSSEQNVEADSEFNSVGDKGRFIDDIPILKEETHDVYTGEFLSIKRLLNIEGEIDSYIANVDYDSVNYQFNKGDAYFYFDYAFPHTNYSGIFSVIENEEKYNVLVHFRIKDCVNRDGYLFEKCFNSEESVPVFYDQINDLVVHSPYSSNLSGYWFVRNENLPYFLGGHEDNKVYVGMYGVDGFSGLRIELKKGFRNITRYAGGYLNFKVKAISVGVFYDSELWVSLGCGQHCKGRQVRALTSLDESFAEGYLPVRRTAERWYQISIPVSDLAEKEDGNLDLSKVSHIAFDLWGRSDVEDRDVYFYLDDIYFSDQSEENGLLYGNPSIDIVESEIVSDKSTTYHVVENNLSVKPNYIWSLSNPEEFELREVNLASGGRVNSSVTLSLKQGVDFAKTDLIVVDEHGGLSKTIKASIGMGITTSNRLDYIHLGARDSVCLDAISVGGVENNKDYTWRIDDSDYIKMYSEENVRPSHIDESYFNLIFNGDQPLHSTLEANTQRVCIGRKFGLEQEESVELRVRDNINEFEKRITISSQGSENEKLKIISELGGFVLNSDYESILLKPSNEFVDKHWVNAYQWHLQDDEYFEIGHYSSLGEIVSNWSNRYLKPRGKITEDVSTMLYLSHSITGQTTSVEVKRAIPKMLTDEIAVGLKHYCAIREGAADCWGEDIYGDSVVREYMTPPSNLVDPRSITVGFDHACVIDLGDVVCWGKPGGDYLKIPSLVNPEELITNGNLNCVIDQGDIKCWGKSFPVAPDFTSPRNLAIGASHACVIDENEVKCWGAKLQDQEDTLSKIKNPKMVTAGTLFSCVLHDGGIDCWGTQFIPEARQPALVNPTYIEVDNIGACAIDLGQVVCWGAAYRLTDKLPENHKAEKISFSFEEVCTLKDKISQCF